MESIRPHAVRRYDDGTDRWELVDAAPARRLGGLVTRYTDYVEQTASFTARRELASTAGVLLFNLGEPLKLIGADGSAIRLQAGEAFAAGIADGTSISRSLGSQQGMHVFLPLESLATVVGAPLSAIANRVVPLDALMGDAARDLGGRLMDATAPERRFSLLDSFLEQRLAGAIDPDPMIAWARRRLEGHDAPSIASLASETGWSRKHLTARFRDRTGFTPDTYRRLARFERFWRAIAAAPDSGLAALAAETGYHDQAHMTRDVRAFSEMTPGQLRERLIPAAGGVRDD